MAKVHGKNTYISVDGDDLSTYCNTSTLTRDSDEHDTTTYGKNDHVVDGGLRKGNGSLGGIYHNGLTGPGAVLRPLVGTVVPVVRRTEGTGTGKPQEAFNALIKSYVETNPVADFISWSSDFTISDAVTDTTQA